MLTSGVCRLYGCVIHSTSSACVMLCQRKTAVPLSHSRRAFIEHSTDPKQWRSPEKAEVKRRHPGVKLGSEFARIREQAEMEQKLVDSGQFTDWNIIMRYAVGSALLLVGLQFGMDFIPPNPSPEYTPYTTPRD